MGGDGIRYGGLENHRLNPQLRLDVGLIFADEFHRGYKTSGLVQQSPGDRQVTLGKPDESVNLNRPSGEQLLRAVGENPAAPTFAGSAAPAAAVGAFYFAGLALAWGIDALSASALFAELSVVDEADNRKVFFSASEAFIALSTSRQTSEMSR
jgi:hypothetical protein